MKLTQSGMDYTKTSYSNASNWASTGEASINSLRIYIPNKYEGDGYPNKVHIMPEGVYEHKVYPTCISCRKKFVPIKSGKQCILCYRRAKALQYQAHKRWKERHLQWFTENNKKRKGKYWQDETRINRTCKLCNASIKERNNKYCISCSLNRKTEIGTLNARIWRSNPLNRQKQAKQARIYRLRKKYEKNHNTQARVS